MIVSFSRILRFPSFCLHNQHTTKHTEKRKDATTLSLPRVPWLIILVLSFSSGCKSHCDLVEAELRTRESELFKLRDELYKAEAYNMALQHQVHDLGPTCPQKISPEHALQTYTLKEIALGRGTGGYDDDDCPGDEALQVVLQPNDCDGHTIKAPGTLHIEAQEVSPEGLKKPICTWDIPPQDLRKMWRSGLLSTGYNVVLPWKVPPSTTKVRIIAQFLLSDGRAFEADKDVTIKLPYHPPRPRVLEGQAEEFMAPADTDIPLLPSPKTDAGPYMPASRSKSEKRTSWKPTSSPGLLRDAAKLGPPVMR